ncbi:non-ribosomal peptide synthetase [Synechococcus sp. PCC 7336]|uniref:non-ribosomal peptide synthetase n=1 Tax=Synechococcus sp. PCC 7336 TaxID=195250 RepID=UPI0003452139|nr:non-ribosomal peptide synthetase [Synechococcus sp. PCC 7336]
MTAPVPNNLSQRIAALSPEQRALFEQRLQQQGLKLEISPAQQTIPRRPPSAGPLPVSFAQQRLWFLNQLETDSPFYNIPMGLRMKGPLKVEALRRSFAEIVRRQDILRTTFISDRGQPLQVIRETMPLAVPLVDLQALPEGDRQAEAERLTATEIRLPYDLERGPLLRATILRADIEDHTLLLSIHHTVADGWSRGVLLRELADLYAAFVAGKPSPLPELAIQYADFALWQRDWLEQEQQAAQLKFWQTQLEGLTELALPKDRQRLGQQTYCGAKLLRVLSPELLDSVKQLSQKEGTTLFMTLLSVFEVLLHRYTAQTDIAVGSPTANRNWKEVEPLIGFFVNALVLRTDLSGDPTFRDVLHAVQTVTLDAFSHRDIPFEQLVEQLQPDRSLSYNPLFQVAFQFQDATYEAQNSLLPSLNFPHLSLERLEIDQGTSIFDLTVNMGEIAEGLGVLIEYSTDLFDRWRIEQMLEHFQVLLQGAIAAPDTRISRLPLVTEADYQQVAIAWNETACPIPTPQCLHELVADRARTQPAALAIADGSQQLTYRELDERANQLAHFLQQRGVGPDIPVGVCLNRSVNMAIALLGVLKAGGAYLPLDPAYPAQRLAYMLEDARVGLVLTQMPLLQQFDRPGLERIDLDRDGAEIFHYPVEAPSTPVTSQNLAYVIYTSGSTGYPKGVAVSHGSLSNLVHWHLRVYDVTPQDRASQIASLAFDASVWEIWPYLAAGASLHLPADDIRLSPLQLVKWLDRERITLAFLPTPLAEAALVEAWPQTMQLRALLTGGDKLTRRPCEEMSCLLTNHYGPTENTVVTTWTRIAPSANAMVPPSIGRPIDNVRVYVLDAWMQPVPIGVPGELFVGGASLARGYLHQPAKTAERFIPDPFSDVPGQRLYRSGDRVRARPDGKLEFLGRVDAQVKLRGFRIEPGEIEAMLDRHPAVGEAIVLAKVRQTGDARLVAYIKPSDGSAWPSPPAPLPGERGARGSVEASISVPLSPELRLTPRFARGEGVRGWGPDTCTDVEQVSSWQQLYDETYAQKTDGQVGTFNIAGWNSSYTGLPLPAEAMREWVDNTVDRILALKPQRVLELGCGTGLLLFQIAPQCEQYWATDFSEVALNSIRTQLGQPDRHLPQVTLEQRQANHFEGIPAASFDTAILNSVIQYFPSADYLLETIAGALHALAPGGSIFIGDVRNLALLNSFHTAIALHRAEADLAIAQLQTRIRDDMMRENELLVQPTFFRALQQTFPQITQIRVQPKLGQHANELTQYRYDVVLQVGTAPAGDGSADRLTWQDWRSASLDLATLGQTLERSQPEIVTLSNIPNSRTSAIQWAIEALAGEEPPATAGELRSRLQQLPVTGIDPQQLWDVGANLGYTVEFSWLGDRPDGSFDAILRHRQARSQHRFSLEFPVAEGAELSLQPLTNNPLQARHSAELVPQLRGYLQERLPDYMVPTAFVVMEEMPLSPNGKVDRRALTDPDSLRGPAGAEFVAPRTPSEVAIAAIWSQLLGVERIGCEDNFFDLGGHSLLVTQVMSRLQQDLQVELPLRSLFEATTVAELAAIVDRAKGRPPQTTLPAIAPTPRPPAIPLSFAQQRLWFVSQLLPDSPAYNMPAFVTLKGSLDLTALRRSLNEIVRRHETLRTNIRAENGTPSQAIACELTVEVPIVDLQAVAAEERGDRAEQWLLAEAKQPFNIATDPLLRVTLVKLAAQDHILAATMHHIVSDGWSAGVLVRELVALYRAYAAGQPSPLPELPIQYADFAIWQRQWLQGTVLEELLSYWKAQLADMPDILELPTDRPRPPLQTFNGAKAAIALEAELTRSLLGLARQTDATLFMALLAGFQLTIYAYARQEKFLLGSPIANRNRPEIEGLVGFFVNTLVLPADLSGDPTFEQLLERVRGCCLGAYIHQDLPFEKLVETLPFQRDLSRAPLVQVAFALQNAPSAPLELPGLTVSLANLETATAKVDLTVLLNDRDAGAGDDSGLAGVVEYNTDLFDAPTVDRIVELYQTLLELAVRQSDRPISQLLDAFDLSQFRPAPSELEVATAREQIAASDARSQFEQLLGQTNLTANQLLVWLGQQLHPHSPLYNNALAFEIAGKVSPAHLQAALQTLLRSRDALRLTISAAAALPQQQILETSPCELELLDFTSNDDPDSIAAWIEQRTRQPLDLSHSPIDCALLKRSETDFILYVNVHQIAADGVSLSMFLEQLSELYELALQAQLPAAIASPQFEHYRQKEQIYRQSARYEKAKQYWTQTLATATDTASYFGRSAYKTGVRSVRTTRLLDRQQTAALKSLAAAALSSNQTEDAALLHLFLAIYAAYLYRIGDSDRVTIGIPLHNRRSRSLKRAIGPFMQVVPLQVEIDPSESIIDLAQRIAGLVFEAMRHGQFPLRNPAQQPVYDAILNFHTERFLKLGPLPLQPNWIHAGSGTDSIAVQIRDFTNSGEFAVDFDLHADLFDRALGEVAIRQFFQVVEAVLRDRDRAIAQLDLLLPEERQRLLVEFNPATQPSPASASAIALFEARVAETPLAIAALAGQQSLTYAQLNAKANQLARHLRGRGVGAEVRVGICCQRSLDLLVGLLGILKAGGAYVPLDPTYPDRRLNDIAEDAALGLILTQTQLSQRFAKRETQLLGLDSAWETIAGERDNNLDLPLHPDSLAYIIYTSGSSGRPKGVGIPHRALASFTETAIDRYEFCASDRILQFASVSFDAAVEEIFPCLAVGATLCLRSDEMLVSPTAFLQACLDWQLTVLDLPTAYWQQMVQSLADSNLMLPPSLRLAIIGGERATLAGFTHWQALCDRQPSPARPCSINTYGPTEATVVATAYTYSADTAAASDLKTAPETEVGIPIGSPLENARVYLLDRHRQPVPVGVPGELYIGGCGLARGYLNRPDLTAAAFVPNPFGSIPGERLYRTGDIGRYRADGEIEYLGRRDRQVKWRGFRLELEEIETALASLPEVKDAAVLLRQDRPQPPRLVAYYTAARQTAPKPSHLRSLLEAKLPQYMLPSHFLAMEAMPLTPSGKLDRRSLPAPGSDRSQLETAYVQPTTALERTIADIWQQVLGVERVGLHDNFFDLGGHSLLLVQVHSQLQQRLGESSALEGNGELVLVDLFQYPTVQRLAERIARGHRSEDLAARADDRARKQKQALSQRRRQQARRQTHA